MEGLGNTDVTMVLKSTKYLVINVKETGEEVVEAVDPLVLNTTDGHMVCVSTKVPI